MPVEQANGLIASQGYAIPAQEDLDTNQAQQDYGGIGNTIKAAGEGLVRGVLPGGGKVLQVFGDAPEAQKGRELANPGISGTSEIGGMGLGLLAGTGEEKLAAEGLDAASGGGGLYDTAKSIIGAPTKAISGVGHAITDAATPEAANLAQKALGLGLGSAAEGAAYGLGQSLDDSALGDPNALGENLLHNVGYSALFAGGLGSMMAPFAKETSKAEELFSKGASPMDAAVGELPTEEQEGVISSLKKEKANAQDIRDAAQTIGAPVLPIQVADSPTIIKLDEALGKRTDEVGIAHNNQMREAQKIGSDAVENNLSNVTGDTAAETGAKIRDDLANVVEQKYEPLKQAFNEVEQITGPIQLAPQDADGVAKELEQIIKDKNLPKNREKAKFIQDYANSVREASSASELDQLRSQILAEGREDYKLKGFAGNMATILGQAREKFGTLAVNAMPEGAEKIAAQKILDGVPALKKQYGEFAQEVGRHGQKLGLGKNVSPGEFLSKLTDEGRISDEMIAKKLMTKNDTGFLEFLQKNAPDSFQSLMDREKTRILELAHKGDQFNAKAALREIDKLSPELRGLIFKPEELQQIEAGGKYLKSFPREVFASNTTTHANIGEQFSGMAGAAAALATGHPLIAAGAAFKHFYGNKLTSQAMKAAIEHLGPGAEGKVGAFSMLERMNGKFINQVTSKSKALFNFDKQLAGAAAGSVLSKLVAPDDKKHEAMQKQITEYANNPEKLIDDLSKHTQPVFQYAPNIAGGLQKSAARATDFLNSKLPVMPKTGPMGPKLKPSLSQKAVFGNYMNTIENPLHVMDKIKEGTMVPGDLEALSNVYPKTLQQMQQSVYSAMVNHIDKNGTENIPNQLKVQLSLFLGQDMDSSISPQAVAANQAVLSGAAQQKDQQEQQQKTVRPSQKGLSALNKSQNILTNAQQISQRGAES